MKIAILTDLGEVYVELAPDDFKAMLKKFLIETNYDVDKALERIIVDLKKQTLYK